MLTSQFYLTAEAERQWISVNPETVSLDANNVQKTPLQIDLYSGEGSDKTRIAGYLTIYIESVVGQSVTRLAEVNADNVSSYAYSIPADSYPTANRISIYAYSDAARTKEFASKQVNVIADNPIPFPRSEAWSAGLTYKNGEYLIHDGALYMWTSRVPGNTDTDPKTWIANNPKSALWTPYNYSSLLATQIIIAGMGLIGESVFKDNYMFSQYGAGADGLQTNDYRLFDASMLTDKNCPFNPNLMMDMRSGEMRSSFFSVKEFHVTQQNYQSLTDDGKTFKFSRTGYHIIFDYLPADWSNLLIERDAKYAGVEISICNATDRPFQINGLGTYLPNSASTNKISRTTIAPDRFEICRFKFVTFEPPSWYTWPLLDNGMAGEWFRLDKN